MTRGGSWENALFDADLLMGLEPRIPAGGTHPSTAGRFKEKGWRARRGSNTRPAA